MAARLYPQLHDPDWLERQAQRHSYVEMAAMVGCTAETVRKACHAWSIDRLDLLRDEADEPYLSVREVARLLSCSENLISHWIEQGRLPAVQIETDRRRPWRLRRVDVERWQHMIASRR